jgi:hypothetical protein
MVTEATTVLADEERVVVSAAEPVAEHEVTPDRRAWSPAAMAIWLLFALGITLFIAAGRVPIEAGWRAGRTMSVQEIWSLFTLELAQVVGPWLSPVLITGIVLLVLVGSLVCLWLAMQVTDESPAERPD